MNCSRMKLETFSVWVVEKTGHTGRPTNQQPRFPLACRDVRTPQVVTEPALNGWIAVGAVQPALVPLRLADNRTNGHGCGMSQVRRSRLYHRGRSQCQRRQTV